MSEQDSEPGTGFFAIMGTVAKALTGFVGRSIATLLVVLLILQLSTPFSENGRDKMRERRAFLCFSHAPPELPADSTSNIDLLWHEFAQLKEEARQFSLPVDPWGRLKAFGLCGRIRNLSPTNIGFEQLDVSYTSANREPELRITFEHKQLAIWKELDFLKGDYHGELSQKLIVIQEELNRITEVTKIALRDDRPATGGENPGPRPAPAPEPGDGGGTGTEPPANDPADGTPHRRGDFASHVLVTGADQDLKPALVQRARVERILVQDGRSLSGRMSNAVFFRRGTWLRTVVLFKTERDAENGLRELIKSLPYGGYVREIKSWCGTSLGGLNISKLEGAVVYHCQ